MDEQLPPGYFLQTTPEGGRWRLYKILGQTECRICLINAAGADLEIKCSRSPMAPPWSTGTPAFRTNPICTNRIIELPWRQQAPQAISTQLAAWHQEEQARALLPCKTPRLRPSPRKARSWISGSGWAR